MADNYRLELRDDRQEALDMAVKIIFGWVPGGKATYFAQSLKNGIVLFWEKSDWQTKPPLFKVPKFDGVWGTGYERLIQDSSYHDEDGEGIKGQHEEVKITRLPYQLSSKTAGSFLWNWLQEAEYPQEPDIDGSCRRGFFLTTGNFWGMIGGSSYSILQLAPLWTMYGK